MDEVTRLSELNTEGKADAAEASGEGTLIQEKAAQQDGISPQEQAEASEHRTGAPGDREETAPARRETAQDLTATRTWNMDLKKAEKRAAERDLSGASSDMRRTQPVGGAAQDAAGAGEPCDADQGGTPQPGQQLPEEQAQSGPEAAQDLNGPADGAQAPGKKAAKRSRKAEKEAKKHAKAAAKEKAKQQAAAEKNARRQAAEEEKAEREADREVAAGAAPGRRRRRSALQKHRKKRHKKKHYLLKTFLVILVLAAAAVVIHLPYFYVENVSVIGNKAFSDEEIVKSAGVTKGWSIFYVHPILAEHKVKKNNRYIGDIDIDRHLPSTVTITVIEKEGTAQLLIPADQSPTGQKQYVIIDDAGNVMEISDERRDVTLIRNVTVKKAETGKDLEVKEKGVYRDSMKMIRTAEENDFYFKRVELTGSMAQGDIFDDFFVKGRYDNIITSLEKGTLKTVVYKLYQEGTMHGTINIGDNDYCSFTPEN